MKFGRNYHKCQVAEWADAYMNYGALKGLCKEPQGNVNSQELVAKCIAAIKSVEQFYRDIYTVLLLRLHSESRDHNLDADAPFDDTTTYFLLPKSDHVGLCSASMLELVVEFDKLRWYGRVNSDGFRKIARKLSTLSTDGSHSTTQIENALCESEFASQVQCLRILANLNKMITSVTRAHQEMETTQTLVQHTFCAGIAVILPSLTALMFYRTIEGDDSSELEALIDNALRQNTDFSRKDFLYILLNCSIQHCSRSCIDFLISRSIQLDVVVVIEDCLRKVIQDIGRLASKDSQATPFGHEKYVSILSYMLNQLLSKQLNLLSRQDHLGRMLVHYACEYGLANVCGLVLDSLQAWDKLNGGDSRSVIFTEDKQSLSSLKLSVLGHHLEVMQVLINFHGQEHRSNNITFSQSFSTASSQLLLLAVRLNFTKGVTLLLGLDIEINCCDVLGQTPLYLAAQSGNEGIVNLLLRFEPLVDKADIARNWTPLIIACLGGFSSIAEALLKHNANLEHLDHLGWTAIEHASYRGYIPLARALSEASGDFPERQAIKIQRQFQNSSKARVPARGQPRRSINTTESCIVVNLGSLDLSSTKPPVYLSPELIANPLIIHPESFFSLGVSVMGAASPKYIVVLPLLEDPTNMPWVFTHLDPANAKLVFEIFHNERGADKSCVLLGRGMTLLESYKQSQHTKRESLSREFTVPILSSANLDYIGAVVFSFLVSTPFVLPNTPRIDTEALWFENGPIKVVGHRGLGQNKLPATRLQIGENTIQSFLSAVNLGASYVELDVQLTKDYVPVVYHDFLVSETGIDIPMHNLTYEQFMDINKEQSSQLSAAPPWKEETSCFKTSLSRKLRTLSLSASDRIQTETFMARVKHTFDYNSRGCKGNTRDDFIHESFVTFEELLTTLPLDIGMDIEIKYPMLSEATDDWKMDSFFFEANFFTDTILLCLAKHISTRSFLLSSFSPEICILLALKQSRWPILFGNDSGNWQPTELRAANLQEGLRFAKRWNLDGLVLASEPLVFAPHLVGHIKNKGMVCATYGALNDEVHGVTIQANAGVDILIVDNVRFVSNIVSNL